MFVRLLMREVHGVWRDKSTTLLPLFALGLACVVCIMAVGDNRMVLQFMGRGVVWSLMILITLLQAPTLFHQDQAEGFIDDVVLSPLPLVAYLLAKTVGTWARYGLPFLLALPVFLILFQMPFEDMGFFWIKSGVATVHLAFVTLFIGCLTPVMGTPRLLGFFLGVPLYLPMLIALTLPLPPPMAWSLMGSALLVSIPVCLFLGERALMTHIRESSS